MNAKFKKALIYLGALVVVFLIVVPLTRSLTPVAKGAVHATITTIFFFLVFNIWSSFRLITPQKVWTTVAILVAMVVILPVAIEMLAAWPIVIKGFMHLVLVGLILGLIIYVWRDPAKN
ncbi:hypothetical protein [Fundicoccus culcitae]|uniref:Uncharacterized protein n=1 Tax=Fundicoccus culcitae TaxID=2969821 RepID=A0ABY5P8M2_9LACT|nr:hypothetical protein [Fundicoccus culcitae]UUX34945.1 hypothetical protein NRE15_04675 [Fundicoccus culcitae]